MVSRIGGSSPNVPTTRPADSGPTTRAPAPTATSSIFEAGKSVFESIGKSLDRLGLTTPTPPPTLSRNDRQRAPLPEVQGLQEGLNTWSAANGRPAIKADGLFGPKTESSVKEFQRANGLPPTGVAGPGVQVRLQIENNADFQRLNDDTKRALRTQLTAAGDDFTKLHNLERLATSPGLSNLSPAHQQQMVAALASQPTDTQLSVALTRLADSPEFAAASDATKTSLIDTLRTNGPATFDKVNGALALIGSSEFRNLSDADKALAMEGLRGAGANPRYAASLQTLIADPKFQALSADAKTAVLSQAKNYPDARATDNFRLALQKDWFGTQSLADQQRSLKLIGRLSTYDSGDRTIIDNTLNRFLSPSSDYKLVWKEYSDPAGSVTYGSARDGTLWLNRSIVADGNARMVENDTTNHLALSTTPHEVNHNINGDEVTNTFHYFEAEYRAWYVGFQAEHGRPPTSAEALDQRIEWQFNTVNQYGRTAAEAMKDPAEAAKFYDFLSRLSGKPVDASNWRSVIAEDPTTWSTATANAPVPSGNLTNQ